MPSRHTKTAIVFLLFRHSFALELCREASAFKEIPSGRIDDEVVILHQMPNFGILNTCYTLLVKHENNGIIAIGTKREAQSSQLVYLRTGRCVAPTQWVVVWRRHGIVKLRAEVWIYSSWFSTPIKSSVILSKIMPLLQMFEIVAGVPFHRFFCRANDGIGHLCGTHSKVVHGFYADTMSCLPAGSVQIALNLRSNLSDILVQTTYLTGEVKAFHYHAARRMVVVIAVPWTTGRNKTCFLFVGIENPVPVIALKHGSMEIDMLQTHACFRRTAMHTTCRRSSYTCQPFLTEVNPLVAEYAFVVITTKSAHKAWTIILIIVTLIEYLKR